MPSTRRLAVALLVAALLAAGCSSGSGQEQIIVESSAPAKLQKHEQRNVGGAKAFVAFYGKALNRARRSGDVAEVKQMVLPGCVPCAKTMHIYYALNRGKKNKIVGGKTTIEPLRARVTKGDKKKPRVVVVTARFDIAAQIWTKGGEETPLPAAETVQKVTVQWMDNAWFVKALRE